MERDFLTLQVLKPLVGHLGEMSQMSTPFATHLASCSPGCSNLVEKWVPWYVVMAPHRSELCYWNFLASLDKLSCHLQKLSRAGIGFGETLEMEHRVTTPRASPVETHMETTKVTGCRNGFMCFLPHGHESCRTDLEKSIRCWVGMNVNVRIFHVSLQVD